MINELQTKMTQSCVKDNEPRVIIKDRYPLTEGYEPDKIFYREKETDELQTLLKHSWNGWKAEVDVIGTIGCGKTMISKWIVSQYNKRAEAQGEKVKAVYINCKEIKTQPQLLKKIAQEISGLQKVGKGKGDIINAMNKGLEKYNNVILALDEIVNVAEDPTDYGIFYNLADNPKLSLMFISNVPGWYNKYITDPSVRSRLSGMMSISFMPYTQEQIKEILRYRAEKALEPSSWNDKILDTIAEKAAQRKGDMREAISLLRESAETAQITGRVKIDEDCITIADSRLKVNEVVTHLMNQTPPKRVLLCLIYKYMKNNQTEPNIDYLTKAYNAFVDEKGNGLEHLRRTSIRNYLKELESYEFVETSGGGGKGQGSGKSPFTYRVVAEPEDFEVFYKNVVKE